MHLVKKQLLLATLATINYGSCAQIARPTPATGISLDTVAILGSVRQLSLLPPGEKPAALSGMPVSPGHRVAVRYQPPAAGHEYDIRSVTLHFNTLFNASSAGSLLVQLALADSSGAPAAPYLLPEPFVITAKQVRRAQHHTITLAVQGTGLRLVPNGVFVVLAGAPAPTDHFIADTIVVEKHGQKRRVAYVKVQDLRSGAYRFISNADFLSLPLAHTTEEPVTWNFWPRDQRWHRAPFSLPQVPHYRPSNYWVELGVTEL